MKFGFRKPSIKKSISARTTGAFKRSVKRALIPGYGQKGMGFITNPKKAIYNKIYRKTTFGLSDLFRMSTSTSKRRTSTNSAGAQSGCMVSLIVWVTVATGVIISVLI